MFPIAQIQSDHDDLLWETPASVQEGLMGQIVGIVKWFSNSKGYGFLGYAGGADVFVHYSAIEAEGYKSITEGQVVMFDIVQGGKGKAQAASVRVLQNSAGVAVGQPAQVVASHDR